MKNLLKKIKDIQVPKKMLHPYDKFARLFFPIIPKWVTPNLLTAIRIFGLPFLVLLLWKSYFISGLALFIFLALTDMFDGALARGRNQITYWGILLDPIADKLLIGTTVVVLLIKVNVLLAVVVIAIELAFLIGGLIKTSRKKAVDLEANFWGKFKMNVQVLGIGLLFIGLVISHHGLIGFSEGTLWFSAGLGILNIFSHL